MPLHLAIEYKRADTVVLTFLAGNKQASKVSNCSGYLPLHMAIEYNCSDTENGSGNLILHLAIEYNCSDTVVLTLLAGKKQAS